VPGIRTQMTGPARAAARAGVLLMLAAACSNGGHDEDASAPDSVSADTTAAEPVVLEEAFLTERDTLDNVDSPTVWNGPNGEHWILTSAKTTDVVLVNDAATGAEIRRLGGTGSGRGQLDRPNGVRAIDDLLFVVERDNARIQAFSLPSLESMGTFGEEELLRPYGIAAYEDAEGRIEIYVTDNYELVEDEIPPDSALGERVEQFRVWVEEVGHALFIITSLDGPVTPFFKRLLDVSLMFAAFTIWRVNREIDLMLLDFNNRNGVIVLRLGF